MTIASVIHQHVNWANLVFDLRNGWVDRAKIGNVQNQGLGPFRFYRFKLLAGIFISHRSDDGIACRQGYLRESAPKA